MIHGTTLVCEAAMTRDHRRLAAIVMADIAGYSLLVGRNDEATLVALEAHRREFIDPTITQCNGRIVDAAGDSLLLEFASVVDAVRCATSLQRGMAARNLAVPKDERIEFRIGINVGDIIVNGQAIVGDGVNVAARLQSLADPGGICVSSVVYDELRGRKNFSFEALGTREVKNIARPIEVYRLATRDEAGVACSRLNKAWRTLTGLISLKWVIGLATSLSAAGLGLAALPHLEEPPPDHRPPAVSLAILPFETTGSHIDVGDIADRFTQSLTMAFSKTLRLATLRPYNSTIEYKHKPFDALAIGKALNVRYLVRGQIELLGDAVTVNVQLIDAQNLTHVWSDRIDDKYDRLESPQNGVVRQLTRGLREALVITELRRVGTRKAADQTAVELALRASNIMTTRSDLVAASSEALRVLDQALAQDPNLLSALVWRGHILELQRQLDPNADAGALLAGLEDVSKRAVAADPTAAGAWRFRSDALIVQGRLQAALEANTVALGLDETEKALVQRSWLMILHGRPEEALRLLDDAAAINPDPRKQYGEDFYRCAALMGLGRYEEAAAACEKSVAGNDQWLSHLLLTAAYAQTGDTARTEAARAALLKHRPGLTIASVKALDQKNASAQAYVRLADAHFYSGLRKAGIPEK